MLKIKTLEPLMEMLQGSRTWEHIAYQDESTCGFNRLAGNFRHGSSKPVTIQVHMEIMRQCLLNSLE